MSEGLLDGLSDGAAVGTLDGLSEGLTDGAALCVGAEDGASELPVGLLLSEGDCDG